MLFYVHLFCTSSGPQQCIQTLANLSHTSALCPRFRVRLWIWLPDERIIPLDCKIVAEVQFPNILMEHLLRWILTWPRCKVLELPNASWLNPTHLPYGGRFLQSAASIYPAGYHKQTWYEMIWVNMILKLVDMEWQVHQDMSRLHSAWPIWPICNHVHSCPSNNPAGSTPQSLSSPANVIQLFSHFYELQTKSLLLLWLLVTWLFWTLDKQFWGRNNHHFNCSMVLGWQQKLNIHHVSGVAEMVDLGRKGLILSFIARWHRPFIYLYIYNIYIYFIYRSFPLSPKSDARKTLDDYLRWSPWFI